MRFIVRYRQEVVMRVSVFIPCHNAEKYIAESLESIIRQTYRDFQIVIIDDGSSDKSRDIIEKYARRDNRIKLLFNLENMGQIYTRNRGLLECNTEYIALMDADDVAPIYRLQKEVDFLDSHGEVGAVGGEYYLINENGKFIGKSKIKGMNGNEVKSRLFFRNILANSSMMFRTEVIKKYNIFYRRDCRILEDYRFWCEFSNYAPIVNLPCILLNYRVVNTGLSQMSRRENKDERNKNFDIIHDYMIQSNHFSLIKEKQIFWEMIRDDFSCQSLYEWNIALKCLSSLVKQCGRMNKPYKRDMEKQSFSLMVCFTKKLFTSLVIHKF